MNKPITKTLIKCLIPFICFTFILLLGIRVNAQETNNYSDYWFYDSNGEKICVSDFDEDAVVLIFGRETCGLCQSTMREASKLARFETSVKVVFLKIDDRGKTETSWDDFCETYEDVAIMTKYSMYYNSSDAHNLFARQNNIDFVKTPLVIILNKNRDYVDGFSGCDNERLVNAISSVTQNKCIEPDSLWLEADKNVLHVGESVQIKAVYDPKDTKVIYPQWSVFSYSFDENDNLFIPETPFATIDNNGVVKALSPGYIYVYYSDAYGLANSFQITIKKESSYKVNHFKENLDGTYSLDLSESFKGDAGDAVIVETKYYEGFNSPYSRYEYIKEDGSTVIEYKYTRKEYTLVWDLDGGKASGQFTGGDESYSYGSYLYGKVKYGTPIIAPKPSRDGYIFDGWDITIPKTMPAHGFTATAKWKYDNGNNCGDENCNGQGETKEEQVRAFVTRFYTIILQRSKINEDEINYYTSRLLSKELDGCSVAKGFVLSPEYANRGENNCDFVNKMYAAFFNRDADDAAYYVNLLESGQSREVVLAGFVNSPEFKNLCADYGINPGELVVEPQNNNQGNNGNNQGSGDITKLNLDSSNVDPDKLDAYVKGLYQQILGRGYDEGGLQYWKEQIMAGTTYDAATAARVGFFESEEYKNKNKNSEQFVTDCYHAFLGREPEPDGLSYWMKKIDSGEYSKQKVIDLGFGHSEEFKNILRGCGFKIIE